MLFNALYLYVSDILLTHTHTHTGADLYKVRVPARVSYKINNNRQDLQRDFTKSLCRSCRVWN